MIHLVNCNCSSASCPARRVASTSSGSAPKKRTKYDVDTSDKIPDELRTVKGEDGHSYLIERIYDKRTMNGATEYKVSWTGYSSPEEDTWEAEDCIKEVLEVFRSIVGAEWESGDEWLQHKTSIMMGINQLSEDKRIFAMETAQTAVTLFDVTNQMASFIQKEFEGKYEGTWNCIVGKDFGSAVTHEDGHFIYFYVGDFAVLLFKSCQ